MRPLHPFQKHFCLLFLSFAILTTYISLKKKYKIIADIAIANNTFDNNSFYDLENDSVYSGDYQIYQQYINFSGVNMSENKQNSNVIHILGLFELTTRWGRRAEGESEMLSAQLAVDHVNSLNVLPGYTLKLLVNDTKCDPGIGIDRFFYAVYSKKRIFMLLGAGCSNVTERLALVVPYWNIVQVSFGSTSPSLSDRNKFPLFFRTVAPDSSHNNAKIHFIKKFGWKVVATFSQSENEYLLPINHLITDLERANISCISTVTFSVDNYKDQLRVLKDLDVRIIIGSFSTLMIPRIFCAIFQMEMMGGEYVWILQNREEVSWNSGNDCSISDLHVASEGIIMVSDYNDVFDNEFPISGWNNDEFEQALNMSKHSISKYAKQTYDAVWTIALSLRGEWMNPLEIFQYTRKDIVCRWVERMGSLKFIGLSVIKPCPFKQSSQWSPQIAVLYNLFIFKGPLKFDGADRIGNSVIRQIQDGTLKDIALFDSIPNTLDFNCKTCHKIRWKNGQTPLAQRILRISLMTIPSALFYSITMIALIGIGASFLFLFFNLRFRRIKSLKLSSPKINNVAVLGCILVYSSTILLGLNNTTIKTVVPFSGLCFARIYLLSAGFSLAFGSMLAKTYRVHRLFTYIGAGLVRDKFLKDNQLIGLILIPLLIDTLILILWATIDPMERHIQNLTMETSFKEPGVVCQSKVELCISQNTEGWYIALFGYKSIILVMGVYMAWNTRHIKVPALNDSQYIGISVYSAVFTTIIVIVTSFISNYFIFVYLAKMTCILTSTTMTLLLLFLPKLKLAFRKIDSEDPVTQSMGLKIESNTRRFITDDPKELICRLEIQNRVYKCEMAALDKEITRLEELLQSTTTCSTKSSMNIVHLESTMDCYLTVPNTVTRASWPSTQSQLRVSRSTFHSENKLTNDFFDRIKLFGRLKKYFVSITPLNSGHHHYSSNTEHDFNRICNTTNDKPNSSPEVYQNVRESDRTRFARAKSDLDIQKYGS